MARRAGSPGDPAVAALLVPFLNTLLRIGGSPRVVITYAQTGAIYVSAAWLAMIASIIVGEWIVASEHLTARSLDSQLIRLGTRLVGIVAAIAILIQGADESGVSGVFGAGRVGRRRVSPSHLRRATPSRT